MKSDFKHTIHLPWIIKKYLDIFKFDALTTFWGVIYYKDINAFNDLKLKKHEIMHENQMKRDGYIIFHIKYTWYLLIYGYWNNPYEVEARKAEDVSFK